MAWDDLIRVPITHSGDLSKTIGFAMIDPSALAEIEPYPVMYGLGFTYDAMTGKVLAIDVFAHEAVEDLSIEAEAREVDDEDVREISSGGI